MPISALFFDLDDTIIVDEAVSRETFEQLAQQCAQEHAVDAAKLQEAAMRIAVERFEVGPAYAYCKEIGISAFEVMWGTFEGEDPRLQPLHDWRLGYRLDVWNHALAEASSLSEAERTLLAQELADGWASARATNLRHMPGALELLNQLKGTYKLGLLTNGSPSLQRHKIDLAKIEPYFDAIAISGEVKIGKPKPGIFTWLCDQAGVPVEEAVMVGNSLGRDIKGAQNAGMRSIWIDVPGAYGGDPKVIQGDVTIKELLEIPALLPSLEAS